MAVLGKRACCVVLF